MEKLEISLTPDLMKRIDDVVELLGLESREEFLMAAIRRMMDHYSLISKSIPRAS
jgi:metal-responsive CopG/Arc/MetJ family transcriptional regulator